MGIFDKCLFRYRARLLDIEGWFFAGYAAMIDEYRRSFIYTKGGNHNITIGDRTASSLWIQEHIRNLEQQYHLFIQKVNNIPIEEVILDISAERLLHGLSGVVV